VLFNPRTYEGSELDPESRRIMLATIEFFESRGKAELKRADHEREWYADFLDFVKRERVFSTLLTPAAEANGDERKRWDTARICAFNEITGFYGLAYWYTWQVSILGLGPIWQSGNAEARRRAAELLDDGAIFAFGLSEREHGADIYSTDMVLTSDGNGGFRANGGKYATCTNTSSATPAATKFLAIWRVAYAALRSTLLGSLPEKAPPP
jgi:acyl-CoA dehydrogenase